MPCPLCNHTLQNLGLNEPGRRTFWCPRCGTLQTESGEHIEHEVPRVAPRGLSAAELLDACRTFLGSFSTHVDGTSRTWTPNLLKFRDAVRKAAGE